VPEPWVLHRTKCAQSPPRRDTVSLFELLSLKLWDAWRTPMSDQDNIRIARQSWDAWNAHDVDGVLKVLDEKHVWETDTLPAPVVGRDGYRQAMQMYLTAFPRPALFDRPAILLAETMR